MSSAPLQADAIEETYLVHTLSGMRRLCAYLVSLGAKSVFPFEVTIRRVKKKGTLKQNSYLHVLLRKIAKHTGHSEREVKDILKERLLDKQLASALGDEVWVTPDTSDLDPEEKSRFIEKILLLAQELGLSIEKDPELEQTR